MTPRKSARTDYPFLRAALICERVLLEKDGVKSVIRIFDRTIGTALGPKTLAEMPKFIHQFAVFISFVRGKAKRRKYTLRIDITNPSGKTQSGIRREIEVQGQEDSVQDVIANISMEVKEPGLYWFGVYLGGKRMTRIPLRIVFAKETKRLRNQKKRKHRA